MEKRLKNYITYLQNQLSLELPPEELGNIKESLLIQINFFQHERMIHLIVTATFAILTFFTFALSFIHESLVNYLLLALFLVLLIPYIRHYYILENGVQKLYKYYDKLQR